MWLTPSCRSSSPRFLQHCCDQIRSTGCPSLQSNIGAYPSDCLLSIRITSDSYSSDHAHPVAGHPGRDESQAQRSHLTDSPLQLRQFEFGPFIYMSSLCQQRSYRNPGAVARRGDDGSVLRRSAGSLTAETDASIGGGCPRYDQPGHPNGSSAHGTRIDGCTRADDHGLDDRAPGFPSGAECQAPPHRNRTLIPGRASLNTAARTTATSTCQSGNGMGKNAAH